MYHSYGIADAFRRPVPRRQMPRLGGLLDDLMKVGSGLVNDATKDAQGKAGDEVEKLLKGSELAPLLDKIEGKAHDGAIQAAKENAPWVVGLCIAAGLLGGAVGNAAGGKVAGGLGILGGAFSAYMIARGGSTK